MRRETSRQYIVDLIARIRAGIPGIALRTTFIVGFPGETEKAYQELKSYVAESGFDRVAAFLRATRAQYLITTPSTHNINVFSPVQLTLVTQKKRPGERWAPPVAMLRKDESAA